MSTNPSSELYSEESTEDVADVDSLYQQSASSNPWPLNQAEKVTLRNMITNLLTGTKTNNYYPQQDTGSPLFIHIQIRKKKTDAIV